jgi:hypothetical protein
MLDLIVRLTVEYLPIPHQKFGTLDCTRERSIGIMMMRTDRTRRSIATTRCSSSHRSRLSRRSAAVSRIIDLYGRVLFRSRSRCLGAKRCTSKPTGEASPTWRVPRSAINPVCTGNLGQIPSIPI